MKYDPKSEQSLMTELWDPAIAEDLERFVLFAYPWGKANTPLHDKQGPRTWQRDVLQEMTDHIKNQRSVMDLGLDPDMYRDATGSGRGIGKSALLSWLVDWMMTTNIGSTTLVTANTEPQLKSRTFAEIGKWTTLLINAHWFEATVLTVRPAPWFSKLLADQLGIDSRYYYAQGQLWSEENPDAFAGIHNPAGLLVMFDEASGIPAPIYKVTEGFFTEPVLHRYWVTASNPRRTSGPFYDSFHEAAEFWRHRQIDSRTVEGTDQKLFARMIKQYGIDSDTVKVEVLGQFPSQGDRQFISNQLVFEAQRRALDPDPYAPLILGVDIARFGRDNTVLRFRQGRDARSIPAIKIKQRDNMTVANKIAEWIDRVNPDAVNIDAGNGTGVIDRLREMRYKVHEVWFGSDSDDPQYENKRTQMYGEVRAWLPGGMIDTDPQLFTDLTAPEYDFFGKAKDKIMLESKESLVSRGFKSPDDGDALALTFAKKVARKNLNVARHVRKERVVQDIDYPLMS